MNTLDCAARVKQVTWVGIWVNLVLSIVKILAGIFGASKALIADGIESAMDIVTSFALLVGAKFWNAPPDKEHPYGHRRIETILTLGIGVVVGLVGISITLNALLALRSGQYAQPTMLAFAFAVVSVIGKELLFQWSVREGKRLKSMAVVANAWHHRSDAISSIPIVITVGVAQFVPSWTFLDSVGAIVASGFIIKASFDIIAPAMREMVDTGAPEEILNKIQEISNATPGVKSVHDLRTRFVGAQIHVDLHIVVDASISVLQGHEIADLVRDRLKELIPDVIDVLVHIDPSEDQ